MSTDPNTPAWVLDVAEDVKRFYSQHLIDAMLERDEDVTDNPLWQHRRSQLDSVLASGTAAERRASVTPAEAAEMLASTPARLSDWLTPEQRLRYGPALLDSTIREALRIAVTAAENDRQAERFEAALAAMDREE